MTTNRNRAMALVMAAALVMGLGPGATAGSAATPWGYVARTYDGAETAHVVAEGQNMGLDSSGGLYIAVPDEARAMRIRLVDATGLPVRALIGLPGRWDYHENLACGPGATRFELEPGEGRLVRVLPDAGVVVGGTGRCAASVSTPTRGVVKVQFLR